MASNDRGERGRGRSGRMASEDMTRFFINLGRKDRLNPAKLMGLINEQGINNKVEIGAIDILDTFSFFEIDKNFESDTLDAFSANSPEFNGRRVNIEITKTERKGGGGRRRGGSGRSRRSDDNPSKGFGRTRNNKKKPFPKKENSKGRDSRRSRRR